MSSWTPEGSCRSIHRLGYLLGHGTSSHVGLANPRQRQLCDPTVTEGSHVLVQRGGFGFPMPYYHLPWH